MHDIETLIDHFLGVSWGPVIPPGEAVVPTESMRGATGYYLHQRRRRELLPHAHPHAVVRRTCRCCR